jgi:hypothetical protein
VDFTWNSATAATLTPGGTAGTLTVSGIDMTGCTAGGPLFINFLRLGADGADTNSGGAFTLLDMKAAL